MAIGLDDALLDWLVASAGGGLVRWLRGDPARAAMSTVVEGAVEATVAEVAGHLDGKRTEHLRSSLLVHDVTLNPDGPVTNEAELRDALHTWAAMLDHPEFGEPGYLSHLDVDPEPLADALTSRIADGIRSNGRSGGALNPLAEWLWRDELSADISDIKWNLSQLRSVVEPPKSYRGGLPGVVPDFTGRQQVLTKLAERVEAHDPAGIVVAIHAVDGMAGVGKTELALRVAHQHKHRYPDGQHFINLHGYTEGIPPMLPEAALEELLRQAGMTGQEIPLDLSGRQARWQALMAGRQALVVLDNALDVDQVRALLPMSAGCLVLITSRSRLTGLPGAQVLPLEVLAPAEAIELFARVVGTHRQLDLPAMASVVELVGHLPVAVRAAAGQVGDDYTEAELADDLGEAKARTGRVNATGPLGAGVRAAFETSLQRLDQPHRRAFRVLGVHPGPTIGVPQFAALAGLPTARAHHVLRRLADRNLLTPARDRVGHRRYQLHDLLREFARQQAEAHMSAEDRSAAIARLITWYINVTSAVERLWDGDAEPTGAEVEGLSLTNPGEARAWLAAEQDNLLALAEFATGVDVAHVCDQYGRRLYFLDHYAAARTLHQSAAAFYQQSGSRDGEAHALTGLGEVAQATGDYRAAGRHFGDALAIYQQTGNRAGQADALRGLGQVARFTGGTAAGERFRDALAIYQQTGNRVGQADALRGLGQVARFTGDYPAATEHFGHARAIYQQTGNRAGEAYTLNGLGEVARFTGNYPAADKHYRHALTIYRQIGDRAGEAYALNGLGEVARFTGNYPAADKHYRHALAICQQTGNRAGEAYALNGLGKVARFTGNYPAATEHFGHARAICQQTGNRGGEAYALNGLGKVARFTGNYPAANEYHLYALAICQQIGDQAGQAYALTGLGHAAKAEGRPYEARERWQRALAIYVEMGSPLAKSVRESLEQIGQP